MGNNAYLCLNYKIKAIILSHSLESNQLVMIDPYCKFGTDFIHPI